MADIDPDSLSALIKRYAQTYRGIRPHNLNAYLTDHLKWDRYKVHRRLNNTVPWKDSELRDVAAVFGVSVAELTARSAVKQASVPTQAPTPAPTLATPAAPAPVPVATAPGQLPAKLAFMPGMAAFVELGSPTEDTQWVAVRTGLNLVVYERSQAGTVAGIHLPVRRIVLQAAKPHTVAILEDDAATGAILEAALSDVGVIAKVFTKPEELTSALSVNFDAFVFDWYLCRKETCFPTLVTVRSKFPSAPLFITSGKVDKAGENHLLDVCQQHDVTLVPKPYRQNVLAHDIRRAISAAEINSRLVSV